jgi:hypothetical protein
MEADFEISSFQKRVLQCPSPEIVCSCGRGTGKTALIALVAITAMLKGERVLIVTPTFRQAKRDNWQCITEFLSAMKINASSNISELTLKCNGGSIMILTSFGATTETFRGATKISKLIFDEAGTQTTESYLLAIPTMRDVNGAKKQIYAVGTAPYLEEHWMVNMSKRESVEVFFANAADNPFVEDDYLPNLERQYFGLPEEFIRRELYGEMVFSTNNDSMFSGFRITADSAPVFPNDPVICGLDIAGRGSDSTVAVIRQGLRIIHIEVTSTKNDEEVRAFVNGLRKKWNFTALRYDATGFGHLLTFPGLLNMKVTPVDFGGSGGIRFAKTRGLIYHKLAQKKEICMSRELYNMHGKLMESELKATTFRFNESRLINLIQKEKIKAMLGRSPDRADAAALAFSYADAPKTKPVHVRPVFATPKYQSRV